MDPMGLKGIHIFQGCAWLSLKKIQRNNSKDKLLTDPPSTSIKAVCENVFSNKLQPCQIFITIPDLISSVATEQLNKQTFVSAVVG